MGAILLCGYLLGLVYGGAWVLRKYGTKKGEIPITYSRCSDNQGFSRYTISSDEFSSNGCSDTGISSNGFDDGFSHNWCSDSAFDNNGFIDTVHGGIDPTGMGGMAGDHNP